MARMPDFIVIGSAKCGTTSLCDDIARGRSFFVSRPKEPEFFCRNENYAKGLGWYASLFDGCGEGRLAGEGSTMYSSCEQFPEAAARIGRGSPLVQGATTAVRLPDRRLWKTQPTDPSESRMRRQLSNCVMRPTAFLLPMLRSISTSRLLSPKGSDRMVRLWNITILMCSLPLPRQFSCCSRREQPILLQVSLILLM